MLRVGMGETEVFGLRLMWDTVAELSERLSRLYPGELEAAALLEKAFGPLAYVHVSRENKVAQAISLLRAEQSGLWHLASGEPERQRIAPPAPLRYEADRIAEIVAELERDDAAWTKFFTGQDIAPVQVTYEELVVRPDVEVQKILGVLGYTSVLASPVSPRTAKMADHTSQEWEERFRQERSPLSSQT